MSGAGWYGAEAAQSVRTPQSPRWGFHSCSSAGVHSRALCSKAAVSVCVVYGCDDAVHNLVWLYGQGQLKRRKLEELFAFFFPEGRRLGPTRVPARAAALPPIHDRLQHNRSHLEKVGLLQNGA